MAVKPMIAALAVAAFSLMTTPDAGSTRNPAATFVPGRPTPKRPLPPTETATARMLALSGAGRRGPQKRPFWEKRRMRPPKRLGL
jgi:hypothetical protein